MLLIRPLLLLAGTLTATHLRAQVVLQSVPQSSNCPITLSAEPRFPSGITLVPGQTSGTDRAGVHLRLEDPDGRPIRSAEVTLRGIPAIHGAQPAALGISTPLTQTFHVVSGSSKLGSITADLWLAHAVSIDSVSVTAVSFSSAPAWQASKNSSCIAVPNRPRLVGSLR